MHINKWSLCLLTLIFLYANPLSAADEHDHDHAEESSEADHGDEHGHENEHQDEHGHEEENRVHLNDEQRHSAGIRVERLTLHPIPTEIEAPGEIRLNAYASSQVTPRIAYNFV